MKKKEDSPKIKDLKHGARRCSIREGMFASAKSAFGDYYISPFAIAINSSNSLVAMLSSISGLLGPLTQMLSSRLMERYSRKKIILKAVLFESLMLLPLIIISFLFYKGIITDSLPILLLLTYSGYIIFANIGSPAWFSWMGDIVDEEYRGRWFSKRNLILGFVAIILAISASFLLNYFKRNNLIMFGFVILFFFAFVSRMISWKIFKKQYEPKMKLRDGYYFSFWDFIMRAHKNNFGRFAIFRAIFAFTCSISSPLLAVYLLRNLKFDYTTYMIVTLAGSVFSLVALGIWGRFADRYGNYRVLGITSVLMPIIPILWILSPLPVYLILIPSIVGGISWAGFNLAAGNFVYDNVEQQKRGLAVSYYNMLNGIGVFLGAGLGALLIKILASSAIEPIFIIFFIGAVTRMIVILWWIPQIKEIRKTERFDGKRAFKNIIFKEIKPTLLEEAHQIRSIRDYLTKK